MSESTTLVAEETQAAAPATQASNVTEPVNDDLSDGLALLDEIDGKTATQDEARTEPEKRSTEPEALDEELEAVKAAREAATEEATAKTRAAIAKETEDSNKRNEKLRQLDGIQQSFRQRQQVIRAWGAEVLSGQREITQQDIDGLAEMLNQHHAQAALVTSKDYWDDTLAFAKANLPEDVATEIAKGAREGKFQRYSDLMSAVLDAKGKASVKGHYTEAQVREREATAALKALKKFQADPDRYISRTRTAQSRDASGSRTAEPRSLAEAQEMHAGMHASGRKIDNEQMRAYKQRFTK